MFYYLLIDYKALIQYRILFVLIPFYSNRLKLVYFYNIKKLCTSFIIFINVDVIELEQVLTARCEHRHYSGP
jgi:hypothetical protein